jgi:hypothetical protein
MFNFFKRVKPYHKKENIPQQGKKVSEHPFVVYMKKFMFDPDSANPSILKRLKDMFSNDPTKDDEDFII